MGRISGRMRNYYLYLRRINQIRMENRAQIRVPFIDGLEKMSREEFDAAMAAAGAEGVVGCVNWPEQFPLKPDCSFRIARSGEYLAVAFSVTGPDLRATFLEDNGDSWCDSCVEVFLMTDSDSDYYNFETTCIGSVLVGYGCDGPHRRKLPVAEVAKVLRWSSLPHEVTEKEGGSHSWKVSVLIPFRMVGLDGAALPPSIRANFFKCGDMTAHPHFLSWTPISTEKPLFHCPQFFGTLLF